MARSPFGWFPLRRVRVRGPSMAPALADADVVLVSHWLPVRVGVVGLVRWPSRPGQLSVKRIERRCGQRWFVVGDNALASTDSRELGPAEVLGVVCWRLWPRPGRVCVAPDEL